MLSIRDEEVRTLAEAVMRKSGAPNLTAAIKLALQREIKRADEALPLIERVAAIRAAALAKADRPPAPPLSEDERDALWTR
ncbi:type II toxin-antitoxin system VapB family antitoxin [Methylorubrum aminovorans]